MNLNATKALRRSGRDRAVALVITLLMLSVITFLAVAFLAITRRDRTAVTATLDSDTAKAMSQAAQARAQSEIIAQLMAASNILNYDYMASHNYMNSAGFIGTDIAGDPANVNYNTFLPSGNPNQARGFSSYTDPEPWAQNIANLFWDPRPPVFVNTNGSLYPFTNDFRYWVDINRNGMFESNGVNPTYDARTLPVNYNLPSVFNNGEPEWIGVLKYPWTNHSPTNIFIGRYAYMVLPIGKTLDFNYIHNASRGPVQNLNPTTYTYDLFSRDQGVGSWELNLAAALNDTSTNMYPSTGSAGVFYDFLPSGNYNLGHSFDDALQFISFRYNGYNNKIYPLPLAPGAIQPSNYITNLQNIDEYAQYSGVITDYVNPNNSLPGNSWPGSFNTNLFYDPQDLFDTNKTGLNSNVISTDGNGPFATRFQGTNSINDSYDRYTMQRLLACIGMGSAPEYGVYVYSNGLSQLPLPGAVAGQIPLVAGTNIVPVWNYPTWYRTKVNLNYDNTYQITNGPYTPMPTNLNPWAPLTFFTNAADLLLRSQEFPITNLAGTVIAYNHFGLGAGTNGIPIYNSTNPAFCYNAQIHRVLQLAANIYESVNPAFTGATGSQYQVPHVFRPQYTYVQFASPPAAPGSFGIYITNFAYVPLGSTLTNSYLSPYTTIAPYYDFTNTALTNAILQGSTFNISGIPWVIGAVKGLPSFNKYSLASEMLVQRELEFVRATNLATGQAITNQPPKYTNQFYIFGMTNVCGMDAWNPYTNALPCEATIFGSTTVSIVITNNWRNQYYTNIPTPPTYVFQQITNYPWPGWGGSTKTPGQSFYIITNMAITNLAAAYISDQTGNTVNWLTVSANLTNNLGTADFEQSYANNPYLPVHNWTLYVTIHAVYFLRDTSGNLLDYVNLGPIVTSNAFLGSIVSSNSQLAQMQGTTSNQSYFWPTYATDSGGVSLGVQNQINQGVSQDQSGLFRNSLNGTNNTYPATEFIFDCPFEPGYCASVKSTWAANDPLVHYTVDDLTPPGSFNISNYFVNVNISIVNIPPTNDVGSISSRYDPWPTSAYAPTTVGANMLYKDPSIFSANNWQFPTNVFPSIGWLGRVHRGTPWQTVYLKSDNPAGNNTLGDWTNHWVNNLYTYPTNDWSMLDLFTAVPNDNAARGLLSVNQTNDAAWAAVYAGVTTINNGLPYTINPTNDLNNTINGLMEGTTNGGTANGINTMRLLQPDGTFHHIGDILKASALTVSSPMVTGNNVLSDEIVERIPQQTMGLLKVGMPQFVIYAWGQSLRPKNLYTGGNPLLFNLCTNYEITGEYMTRMVCHVVGDPTAASPTIIVDNFNIEPGN